MQFRKVVALNGPNVWARVPVVEAWVDLEELRHSSSDALPGFNERLMAWVPTLIEHRCNVGERGGFLDRLRRGTDLAHILEHVLASLSILPEKPSRSMQGLRVWFTFQQLPLRELCYPRHLSHAPFPTLIFLGFKAQRG